MPDTQPVAKTEIRPTKWDRLNALSTFALALLALFALVFTWVQIREMRRQEAVQREQSQQQIAEMREESKVQHLMELVGRWESPEQIVIRRNLALKRVDRKRGGLYKLDPHNPPVEMEEELDLCEDIGLLTKREYLDRHDVWDEFSEWAFYLYADAHPYLASLNDSDYKECRDLVETMRPIEKSEGNGYDSPDEDDLYGVYLDDIDRAPGLPTPIRHRAQSKAQPQ
jgi:hypothetical protein